MGDYHLVRVGVSQEFWRILQEREPEERALVGRDAEDNDFSVKKQLCRMWQKTFWGERCQRRLAEHLRQQRMLEEAKMRQEFKDELLVDRNHSYFVTQEPVPFLEGWSFRGYLEEDWVMHMMQYATLNHFLILGKAECLHRLLHRYMKQMKSMKWVLLKRQFGEEEQELVEEIYEEYGLAVEVHLLEDEVDLRRMRMVCKVPVVVVDLCEEERVSSADIARGSIWLDMTASEGKRRRLEERCTGIAYFSLKKEWKQPQNMAYQLDTISKNGYNT